VHLRNDLNLRYVFVVTGSGLLTGLGFVYVLQNGTWICARTSKRDLELCTYFNTEVGFVYVL